MVSADIGFILALFIAALGIHVSNKLKMPSSIGLILIGLLFGPAFLGIMQKSEIITFLAGVGLTLMLFKTGIDSDLSFLRSLPAIAVGFFGLVVPWIMGFIITWVLGFPSTEAFFVGVILTSTSTIISISILNDLGVLDKKFSKVIIGAAVVDDILGLIALSIATSVIQTATFDIYSIGEHVLISLVVVIFSVVVGIQALSLLKKYSPVKVDRAVADLIIIGAALLASVFVEKIGFSGIIGAFLAGLVVSESKLYEEKKVLERLIEPLVTLFSPLFFLSLGVLVTFNDIRSGWWLGILFTIIAIISKLIGSYYPAKYTGMDKADSLIISFGMIPRGEIALIAAQIGLAVGVISSTIFSAVIIMALFTSIFPPIIFYYLLSPMPPVEITPILEKSRWRMIETFAILRDLRSRFARERISPAIKKISGIKFKFKKGEYD